jgi:hypothetical protein
MRGFHNIYQLGLNESEVFGDCAWRRVPGGWVVTELDPYAEPGKVMGSRSSVFVPFNREFDPAHIEGTAGLQQQVEGTPPAKLPNEPHVITRPSRMNEDTDDDNPGF